MYLKNWRWGAFYQFYKDGVNLRGPIRGFMEFGSLANLSILNRTPSPLCFIECERYTLFYKNTF